MKRKRNNIKASTIIKSSGIALIVILFLVVFFTLVGWGVRIANTAIENEISKTSLQSKKK